MIGAVDLALLGFAGYRGTQLLVHDSILDPACDRVFAWQQARPDSKRRDFVVTLISCVYCTGWWVAGALLATYLLATGRFDGAPLLVHGIEWLAVAGLAVLMNRVDDTLGRVAQ
ncbi:DUF1360 domain-containing protein [Streptomyces sp. NPDC088733]|uniref:DUF1360 domain-containing protein n=1 Tax=Streptomyces sp. NPDC088733 TaxID=3365880 RepID=UPI00382F1CBF